MFADANIEASMLGKEGFAKVKSAKHEDNVSEAAEQTDTAKALSPAVIIDDTDYILTNLNISRELALIVGVAIPVVDSKCGKQPKSSYLFTYNLKGNLIKCAEVNVNMKDKENTILQTTRDGEYIIMTENCNTIKIMRTFDLTPLYAFNTSDGSANFQMEKIRAINLVDLKYILVGLENGKFLIYNIDFNRWNHEFNNNRY